MIEDNQLIVIMKSLTGGRYDPPGYDWIKSTCTASPPNWYAYMGLMETYVIKYDHRSYEL